jgi:hypothetical protein
MKKRLDAASSRRRGIVHQQRAIGVWLLFLSVVCAAAQSGGEQFVGTWSGTWDGPATGGFEITLSKDQKGALTGKVSVSGEPTYEATLKSVSFEGSKMTARYDFTPDPNGEVVLTAAFAANSATGTWSLRDKASGGELATGGWNVKKK